jgi:hypothetical protein
MSQRAAHQPARADDPVVSERTIWLWAVWATVVALGLIAKFARAYRPDELQHLHVAWNIAHGLLPYRDFFEHHPPLYHLLLTPLVGLIPQLDLRLAIASALVELTILLVSIALFERLLRVTLGPRLACYGVGAWLLLPPYVFKAFELRPDWIALALLLAALLCLARAVAQTNSRTPGWSLASGALAGVGVCLTQKAALPGVGVGIWLLGVWLCAPPEHRRARGSALIGFSLGACLPVAALLLVFARYGAVGALIEHTLLINLGWAREVPWRQGLQDALAWSFGLLVLAIAQAIAIVRHARDELRRASLPSLMAVLSALGLAGYLRSPAPYPQWFLVLVAPWTIYLAAVAVTRYAESPAALRRERWLIGLAALLCAAVLAGTIYRLALVLWVGLALLLWRQLGRSGTTTSRTRWLFGALLSCSLLYAVVSFALLIGLSAAPAQTQLEQFVAAQASPDEPILVAAWPTVAPLHRHGVYDWLFHQGVLDTLAAERSRIEDEYIAAVAEQRVRLALIDPRLVERYMPRFGAYLRQHATRLDLPRNPWQLEAYRIGR